MKIVIMKSLPGVLASRQRPRADAYNPGGLSYYCAYVRSTENLI